MNANNIVSVIATLHYQPPIDTPGAIVTRSTTMPADAPLSYAIEWGEKIKDGKFPSEGHYTKLLKLEIHQVPTLPP